MASKLLAIRLLTRRLSTINFNPNPSTNRRTFSSSRNSTHRAARAASGQAKSLIEDEAELDSWASDLKTDSFRLGLSGSEDDEDFDRKKTSKKTNWDSDDKRSFKKSDRDRGDKSSFGKRDRNLDDERSFRRTAGDSSNGFKDRKSGSGFSEHRRDIGGLDRKFRGSSMKHGEEEVKNRGTKFDGRKSSSNRSSFNSNIYDSNQTSKGGNQNKFMEKRSRGSVAKNRYGNDSEEEEEDMEEFLSMQKGPKSTSMKKGGRIAESSYKQGRGSIGETSEEEDDDEIDGSEDDNELHGSDKEEEDDSDDDNEFYGFDDKNKGSTKDTLLKSAGKDKEREMRQSLDGDKDSYLSNTRFDECSISPLTLKGIKAAGYERMTLVQEATLPIILKGKDVLAKAKTGTGKTVAFLLPAIEIVSKLPPVDRDQKKPPINVLVICPTRELADQAATEANALLKFYPSIGVQCVIGGTRLALEQKRMQTNPCQMLVATPGRLRDHIENTPNFGTRLMGVKVLVLDEADRLLDMGFRKDIEKIVAAVPKQRQTLLFSATVADEVRQICYIAMKRDHEFVNTVVEGSEETHSQVEQMHLIAPLEKQLPVLYGLLKDHIAEEVDYKVIVFCTTAMSTRLVADLLSELRLNTREIHSRKPQSYRTRVSKEFKESKGIILVSSDVSARGVDYPDVTLVIQIGVPADREQYIHRLGRTGRKGKEGKGVLLLAPWEEAFLSTIKDLPITKASAPLIDPDTVKKVERALGNVEMKNKESAYQAWLGYYNSNKMVGRDKYKLVLLANEFSRSLGLENPPAVPRIVLQKMGLSNVPGLRVK